MKRIYWILLSALLFTTVFYKQYLGLNLLIFEGLLFAFLFGTRKLRLGANPGTLLSLASLLTLGATLWTHSAFSYLMNFVSVILLTGYVAYPKATSLVGPGLNALINFFFSQARFFALFGKVERGSKRKQIVRYIKIGILPLVVIIAFIIIYSKGNPIFAKYSGNALDFIQTNFSFLFENFNATLVFLFVFGVIVSNFLFLHKANEPAIEYEDSQEKYLVRRRKPLAHVYSKLALKNEYKAGIFLLFSLNLLLIMVNIIDLNHVWINFEWEGQYLKSFVHKGTFSLILSIVISMGVVLYFFKGNLNFYPNNKWLKVLSYVWIGQNAFLVLSVALRNLYYIQNFALAYKRIGVFIFLILTLYGLYTVWMKVRTKTTGKQVFKNNLWVGFCFLCLCSLVNWDSTIARYNIKHADRAFLHLDFMASLSDKTLPDLWMEMDDLEKIDIDQSDKYAFKKRSYYMDHQSYYDTITRRSREFTEEFEQRSLMSWNWAEYRAYKRLKENPTLFLN